MSRSGPVPLGDPDAVAGWSSRRCPSSKRVEGDGSSPVFLGPTGPATDVHERLVPGCAQES